MLQFPPTSHKHAGKWTDNSKFPLIVIKHVCVCVCAKPCNAPSVLAIGSGSTAALTKVKQLMKMNEYMRRNDELKVLELGTKMVTHG